METKNGRTTAIIAYITMVGALIAMTMNAEPGDAFARYHTRQAFGLHLCFLGFALFLSTWFNWYIWYGMYIVYFGLVIYGLTGALKGMEKPIPVLGPYFQKWFTFIP
ncbi:MAG: hypothetical protein AAFX53_09375 [Bacteroidota bacterium]